MFVPSSEIKPDSEVNHYEGAPEDLPFPTDGSPIYIDHPMFAYDQAMRNVPMALFLHHAATMRLVAFHMKRGATVPDDVKAVLDNKAAWLNGEIPIPEEAWECILEMRAHRLLTNDYPEDHPFGAEFTKKEYETPLDEEQPKREQKKAKKQEQKKQKAVAEAKPRVRAALKDLGVGGMSDA